MARALLVVPPLIKYSAGPLLGPTLLQSAARMRGHECHVLDLNALYIRRFFERSTSGNAAVLLRNSRGRFVGDHDKPQLVAFNEDDDDDYHHDPAGANNDNNVLAHVERDFVRHEILPALGWETNHKDMMAAAMIAKKVQFCFLTHEQVEQAAVNLASSPFGSWIRENLLLLLRKATATSRNNPDLIGLSLLHAGQVIPAAAISMIVKEEFPSAHVVWGGPHISGIGQRALEADLFQRLFAADLFVVGHAEQSFVELLDHMAATKDSSPYCSSSSSSWSGRRRRRQCGVLQGVRGASVIPSFENLILYDDPPVLPAQSTLGCAYGRCTFCTYPSMEPTPTRLELSITIDSVVERAQSIMGATVAMKDSLVTPLRLHELGERIDGRVAWSACTKLHRKLNLESLTKLHQQGLSTLEVGLESLLPDTQRRVNKVHPPDLFESFLRDVSHVPGQQLSLVVNYMTGFPWEDPEASLSHLDAAQRLVNQHLGPLRGKVEHNAFELERLSPMATREPERYNIDSASLKFWPWASVVEYQALR